MKKRVYSKEFKEQAVHLSHQRENIKELAEELGIKVEWLYKWCKWAKLQSIDSRKSKLAGRIN
ncbi:transposase [uncultured Sunxiuqinia sp.]|uniref:transposase n=1 Tax=uncultured Sunxiuqinia sp. TaxID=1573825 RepID=UPI002AA6BB3B|nr:transposase [uncultured Sunxiuqinia sp.]